jgi:hypothetical protein
VTLPPKKRPEVLASQVGNAPHFRSAFNLLVAAAMTPMRAACSTSQLARRLVFKNSQGRSKASGPAAASKGRQKIRMENNMTSKITAILAAAVVLVSAGVASAQIGRHDAVQWQAPDANLYKQGTNNQDTSNLRYGHANDHR